MESNTTESNTTQQETIEKSDESSSNNIENEGVGEQSSTTTKTQDQTQTQPTTTTVQENTEIIVNANEESNPIEIRKEESSSVSVSNGAVEVQSETTPSENTHTQPQPIQTNEEVKNEEQHQQQQNPIVEGRESDNAVNTTDNNVQPNNNNNDNDNNNNNNNNLNNVQTNNNNNANRERTTSQTSKSNLKVSQNSTDNNNNNTTRERTASQNLKQSNNVLGIANYGSDSESGSESESESEAETPKEQSTTQFLGNMEIFKDLATPSPSTPSQHTDTVNPTITALVENFSKEMNSVIDKINEEGNHNNDNNNNTNHITNNNNGSLSPNNTTLQNTQQKSPNSRPPFKPASLITSIPSLHPSFVTTPSPQSRAISVEEWQKSLSRFKQYEDEKKEKVKARLEEMKKGEKMANTFKPTISKKSLELAGGNRDDLFKRIEEGLKASKTRLESARKSKEEAMLKELQKLPTILPASKKLHRNLDDMATWNKAKASRIKVVHEKDKEKEEEDLKTMFKPQINPKSAEIFKSKGEKKSVVKRLTEAPKCNDAPINDTPFQPEINPRSRSIKLESPVFDRLYKSGMQNIISKHRYMVDNWDFSYHNIRKPIHLEAEPGFNFAVNVSSIEQDARAAEYEYEGFNSPNFDHREQQQSVPTDYYQIQQQYQESSENEPEFDSNEISPQEMNRYLETFSDANGYDEELRQLMMQAGFFKTDYIQDGTQMDDINPDEYAPYIIDENGNYIQNTQNPQIQMNIPSQQMYSYSYPSSSPIPPQIPQYYQPYSQQNEMDTNPYYDEDYNASTSPQFQYQYYPTVPELHPVDEHSFIGQGSLSPLSLSPQSESKRLLRSTPQSQNNKTVNNSDSMVKGLSTSSPGKVESQITSPNIGRINNNNNNKRASTPNPIGSKKETPTSNLRRSRAASGGKA